MSSTFSTLALRPRPKLVLPKATETFELNGKKLINIGDPDTGEIIKIIMSDDTDIFINNFMKTPFYNITVPLMRLWTDKWLTVAVGIYDNLTSGEYATKDTPMSEKMQLHALLYSLSHDKQPLDHDEVEMHKKVTEYNLAFLRNPKNQHIITNNRKKQIQYLPDLLHSLQDSDDDIVLELKSDDYSFSDLSHVLMPFACGDYDNLTKKNICLIAEFLTVRKGYNGSNRQTPIPHMSKGYTGGVAHLNQFFVSNHWEMGREKMGIIDIVCLALFRCIGCIIQQDKAIVLLTELLHSKTPLNPGVKEVLEGLLSHENVKARVTRIYSHPISAMMWQTSLNIEGITENNKERAAIAAVAFLFQKWYNGSSLNVMQFDTVAKLFGFDFKFMPKKQYVALNESLKDKTKRGFSYAKWLHCINIAMVYDITDFRGIIGGIYGAIEVVDEKYLSKFNHFKKFMEMNGVTFRECSCCYGSHIVQLGQAWKTIPCMQCSEKPMLCTPCHQKIYEIAPQSGHVMNISSISCICCRSILVDIPTKFPEATTPEDIVDHSNEFYSCCLHGCSNFARVVPEDGIGCADRPNTVVDTFCRNHAYLSATVAREIYKQCPGCDATVMKTSGCNHMTCQCRTEFCMRPGCPYVKPVDGTYNHPFYCRHGISVDESRHVLLSIVSDLADVINGVIPEVLGETILARLHMIIFEGFEHGMQGVLYQLVDYITTHQSGYEFNGQLIHTICTNIIREIASLT